MTQTTERHTLKARRVQFDFSDTPRHWLPNDPFASHLINGIHMLLPAGEFWFCRVYNKALPLITDPLLREDVEGFIRQEAIHARAHITGQAYLTREGFDTSAYMQRVDWLFGQFLGETPLGIAAFKRASTERQWLILRVGIIAAIEHFTGTLGQWAMDNTSWEREGDPAMVDLFKWHLAEEVEHRNVAFDLYEHLCRSVPGFYVSRQALMAAVFPLFLKFLADGYRALAAQDKTHPASKRTAKLPLPLLLVELEKQGRRTGNVPTFSFLTAATLRWLSPSFHPEGEGNTQQALDYLARSPAAMAAAALH